MMFDKDLGAGSFAGSLLRRHGRMILMSVAAVVIVVGLVQGAPVPKPIDFGVVAWLIVRRFGLLRTTVTAFVLSMTVLALTPPIRCGREMAYGAAMKSDLRNLASQEEIYYSDHSAYTSSPKALGFASSEGVEVTVYATQKGWAARATHAALGPSQGCAIYFGESPVSQEMIGEMTPTHPGVIVCTELR